MRLERAKNNHYHTLGLELDCCEQDIKQVYRKLAGRWHPDKWATASADQQQQAMLTFEKIKQAHDVLCDPEERARYDSSLFR